MKKRMLGGCALVVATGAVACQITARTNAERPGRTAKTARAGGVAGEGSPDVITGSVNGVTRWANDTDRTAYSFGTTSCNIGTAPLKWIDENQSDQYPVIGQNMFRLSEDGRFEQIGMGWLKHAFCALQGSMCGACEAFCGGCCDHLGVGCSDPYSSGLNGSQSQLGPRWPVNAHTGEHPNNPEPGTITDAFERRVIVDNDDLDPALNPNALYFIEGQYVTQDDAQAGNGHNNNSYRRVSVQPAQFDLAMIGATEREAPGIQAWQDFDPTVALDHIDVPEVGPGTGRMILGCKVTDNEDGTWSYEYALHNLDSDRSAGSFSVPTGLNAGTSAVGFHDVDYHSGEPWDGTDWATTVGPTSVTWATESFDSNPDANALRWGTLYNFRFRANTPPVSVVAEIGIFKPGDPGDPDSIFVTAIGPDEGDPIVCPGDTNGDLVVNLADLLAVLFNYGSASSEGDTNGDGWVDVVDLQNVIISWGPCV